MTEPEFIYGFGRTKHILAYRENVTDRYGKRVHEIALCGVAGGFPHPEPSRPTCKRCVSAQAKAASA